MDEEKFPCFGSHKVIVANVLNEETPYTINPECEDCHSSVLVGERS